MGSFNFIQYQQSSKDLTSRACQEQPALEPILEMLQQAASEAECLIEQNPGDRSLIDCGPGCSGCCVVNVSTLLPEGFAITRYLSRQGTQALTQAAERLDKLWREVRGLDDDDRLFVRRSCAFLDASGSCSIYPVRPLLCRSITSTSAEDCHEALTGKLLGEEKAVLMHQFQQDLYETLFSGVAEGLEECALDGRSFQLAGLLGYLLRHPEAEEQWLAGRRLTWQDIY